ncbi:MAG: ribulose-phosphate 3-epimerase [Elusimicrobiota bacterium]
MEKTLIAPSILSADFADLAGAIKMMEKAGVDRIHLDVMDGHFVPNITFGPQLVASIRKRTKLLLEAHLMIEYPEKFIQQFKDAGADSIIIHYETVDDVPYLLKKIKSLGIMAGVSINPKTPWTLLKNILKDLDMVLIMTVNPGFGGQAFLEDVLPKISELSKYIQEKKLSCLIEVDGGINIKTAAKAVKAGANVLVAGSSIFHSDDPVKTAIDLKG